jgi:uncharacterized membrane protein YhiD involved in acid resistance
MLAGRYFGFHLGCRQWIGPFITAAGLVAIGLTSASHTFHASARGLQLGPGVQVIALTSPVAANMTPIIGGILRKRAQHRKRASHRKRHHKRTHHKRAEQFSYA